ncbi:VOC family protein [Oceanospirillum sediminis]|uniref:VOC family protein n=1 Tax=Oceanospirillum sediminis TaxID=2760088 RepID=A0A839IPW3_9GAMM|nr:VOC family protein [Oceanospirillum sediminis]MBB1486276.1 VOC family protein [Oceanospirillum sediminis]
MINIKQIHHVAYRCKDAKETVEFYRDVLNMEFLVAIAEDQVPSTKEPDPYMHVFLDAGMGNILAFFELPTQPEMGKDPNTPAWCQHIAFEVEDREALISAKAELEARGIDVIGVTNHEIIHSIYFFDPNGHRLELTYRDGTDEQMKKLKEVAPLMLEEWSVTKRAPKHAAWLHEQEFSDED